MKGRNLKPVEVLNELFLILSYMMSELASKLSSISLTAFKSAIRISFFIFLLIPASFVEDLMMLSIVLKLGWMNCVNSSPMDSLVSIILLTPIPLLSRFLISFVYLSSVSSILLEVLYSYALKDDWGLFL